MELRACYAMSGTDLAYAASRSMTRSLSSSSFTPSKSSSTLSRKSPACLGVTWHRQPETGPCLGPPDRLRWSRPRLPNARYRMIWSRRRGSQGRIL
eukprot:3436005-Rhodomonas_salina.1